MTRNMTELLRQAAAEGLLPDAASIETITPRHWSVVLLTGVAAWFSAVPLMMVAGIIFGPLVQSATGALVLGLFMLGAAVFVIGSRVGSLFVEQLAVPCLLAGAGLVGGGLYEFTQSASAAAVLAIPIACVVAWRVQRPWLRTLAGATIAGLVATIVAASNSYHLPLVLIAWLAWHAAAMAWLALVVLQHRTVIDSGNAPFLALLESVSGGMAGITLAGLAVFSGKTFLLGGLLGDAGAWSAHHAGPQDSAILMAATSAALAVAAAGWLWTRWPAVRTVWFAALACLAVLIAWFAPFLGVVLLILSACASTKRHALACLAGVVTLWIVGGLYYQLDWSLGTKAGLLVGVGLATAAVARFAIPGEVGLPLTSDKPHLGRLSMPERTRSTGLVLTAVLVLAVANVGIWQKENVIQAGKPVFVELAPVDPRSLMQGDFMALRFALPRAAIDDPLMASARPMVVARTDARGIATLLRIDDGRSLAPDEFRIQLVTKHRGWTIATDAWYFKEGESARWAKAKYGEFRIDSNGTALLVGLRGPDLEQL
jgi:uncharacterized membrane-anchored protein